MTTPSTLSCTKLANANEPIIITAQDTCATLVSYKTLDTAIGTNVSISCMHTCIWHTGRSFNGFAICGSDGKWNPPPPFCKQQPTLPPTVAPPNPLTTSQMYGIYSGAIIGGLAISVAILVLLICLWKRRQRKKDDSQNNQLFEGDHSIRGSTERLKNNYTYDNNNEYTYGRNEMGYTDPNNMGYIGAPTDFRRPSVAPFGRDSFSGPTPFGNNNGIITSFPSAKAFNIPNDDLCRPPTKIHEDDVKALPLESIITGNFTRTLSWMELHRDAIKLPRPDISPKFKELWAGSVNDLDYI